MKKNSFANTLYSVVGVVVLLLVLVAFYAVTASFKQRIDLTKEKAYTLSAGTRNILKHLNTPVKIRFYYSSSAELPGELLFLKSYAQEVQDLLSEYKQAAKGKLIIEQLDPKPDSDAEDSARLNGVEGQTLPLGEKFYLGLSFTVGDETEAIPFLSPDNERTLEYDLSRAISGVVKPEKVVVGIMTALPVFGAPSNPMMEQMGQHGSEPWAFVNRLKADYNVKPVDPAAEKIDDDIKVLLVIHPKDITDKTQYAIDQFIMRGGKVAAFLDASSLSDRRGGNDMMAQMPGGGSTLDKLLKAWGLQFDPTKVAADMKFKMQLRGRNGQPTDEPAFLAVAADEGGVNKDELETAQIPEVWLPLSGVFTGTPAAGLTETVLLKTTKESQLVDAMMAAMSGESIIRDFKASGVEYALAVRLSGKFKTAFPEGRPEDKSAGDTNTAARAEPGLKETKDDNTVVLFGDSDLLADQFAIQQVQTPFGAVPRPMNGNLDLAQNIVEHLGGDNNLIGVRSRATLSHPFTRIKDMEAKADQVLEAKQREYEESKQEAEQKITALEANKQPGQQRFEASPEQKIELDKWRKQVAQLDSEWRQEKKRLARDKELLQSRLKWENILVMPFVVALFGISLAVIKKNRTSAK